MAHCVIKPVVYASLVCMRIYSCSLSLIVCVCFIGIICTTEHSVPEGPEDKIR